MRRGGCFATRALCAVALAALVAAEAGQDAPPPQPGAAPEVVQAAAAGYQTPIVDAETNRGLRPTRLAAHGLTHYFQQAKDPLGTLVRRLLRRRQGLCSRNMALRSTRAGTRCQPHASGFSTGNGAFSPAKHTHTPPHHPTTTPPSHPFRSGSMAAHAQLRGSSRTTQPTAQSASVRSSRRGGRCLYTSAPPAWPARQLATACAAACRPVHLSGPRPACNTDRAGLPEDVSHTKQALARGYTLLAMDPHSRDLCWSSSTRGSYVNDQPDVRPAGGGRAQSNARKRGRRWGGRGWGGGRCMRARRPGFTARHADWQSLCRAACHMARYDSAQRRASGRLQHPEQGPAICVALLCLQRACRAYCACHAAGHRHCVPILEGPRPGRQAPLLRWRLVWRHHRPQAARHAVCPEQQAEGGWHHRRWAVQKPPAVVPLVRYLLPPACAAGSMRTACKPALSS